MRWIFALLLFGGCLEYEVTIETTVSEDGSFRRSVAIRESSGKSKTWKRYAPPRAPFELTGNEKDGFVATLTGKPGLYSSGLRVLRDDLKGEYGGADAAQAAAALEGSVRIEVKDLIIGKLYTYREVIDLGIDGARFRADFDFALDLGLRVLVASFELVEPGMNFKPVLENARKNILPELRGSLLVIHSELVALSASVSEAEAEQPFRNWTSSHSVDAIFAELKRIGLRREKGKLENLNDFFNKGKWTIDDRMWNRLLAPLEGVTPEWKAKFKQRVLHPADGEAPKGDPFERAVPEPERAAVEKRVRETARNGFGAPMVNNLFDTHRIRVRVRMPGQLLTADGALLHRLPQLEWERQIVNLLNPVFVARSFVPADPIAGRIGDGSALLRFARLLELASDEDRDRIREFFDAAKKEGLKKALAAFKNGGGPAYKLLNKVLVEK